MSIGNSNTSSTYDKEPLSAFIDPLKKAKLTGAGIETKLDAEKTNIKKVMADYYGITDLTDDEAKAIAATIAGSMNYTVGPMISKRANIGWTTTGHVGDDVALYCYSPVSNKLSGVIENTDVAKYIEKILGLDLSYVSHWMFAPAKETFKAAGAEYTVDKTNPENPVIVVTKGEEKMELPVNKNIAVLNGKTYFLSGITVITDKEYVPMGAVSLIR